MKFSEFVDSLHSQPCPDGMEPCLQALWYDAQDNWDAAHEIVQNLDSSMAAKIHAYLHRKEGDNWNARYWHRRAESEFPNGMTLDDEWEMLVRLLTS